MITAKFLTFSGNGETITYLTPEEFAAGKQGYVLLPYKIITTHTIISDQNGTRRYRQVSRWCLFKLWLHRLFHKTEYLTHTHGKVDKDGNNLL